MRYAIKFYRMINILSLDVAVGAMVSSYFFSRIFVAKMDVPSLLCLGLAVWLIYTSDHLLDAFFIKDRASTLRHRFHQKNFRVMVYAAASVLAVVIALLFFINTSIFFMGLTLSAMVLIYFIIQRKLGFFKEIVGAFLYSLGVMIPVMALSEESYHSLLSIPAVLFFNTALINLVLFSWFDLDNDASDQQLSIATIIGYKATSNLLIVLFFIQFGLLGFAYSVENYKNYLMVFVIMGIILLSVFMKARWFAEADKYRIMGDAVFLIPLVYFIL